MTTIKRCAACGCAKPVASFNKNRAARDGLQSKCRPCHQSHARQDQWARKGVIFSDDQYDAMHNEQKGLCAICRRPETETNKAGVTRRMPLDHDHLTGMDRALLCSACNTGIGKLRDDPDLLMKAAKYILDHRKRHAERMDIRPAKSRRKGT